MSRVLPPLLRLRGFILDVLYPRFVRWIHCFFLHEVHEARILVSKADEDEIFDRMCEVASTPK